MIFAARTRIACLGTMVALLVATHLPAQRFTFRQYGSADGLSNLSVNCLLQDRAGFIWVGTDNGLFRYDGTRFQYFGDAEGLPSSEIQGLAESPDGILWVATQGGLARWTGRLFSAVDVGLAGQLQDISFDSRGRMYLEHVSGMIVGEPDGAGLYRFGTIVPGSLNSLFVKGEDVWFGKDGDLWRLIGDSVKRIGSPARLPIDQWDAIAQDTSGNLWARSATRLYELPAGRARFLNRSNGIPHTSNSHLYPDRHGCLFVSSDSGVVIVGGEGVRPLYIDARHGMPIHSAGPILMDRNESLWVGTFGGGLLRPFGHGEWLSWKKEDGLLDNNVWAVLHDRSGQLWVGTSGGLTIFGPDGRLAHSWTGRKGLAGDQVLSIAEGTSGDVYVGTYPSGISQFSRDGILLRTYGAASGLTPQRIEQIKFDRQGRLWAVGLGGCFRSQALLHAGDKVKFEPIQISGLPAQTLFRDVLADEGGVMWFASSNGLIRFDGAHWRVFTEVDGLKSLALDVLALGKGEIWIGYRDALGITRFRFDGNRVQTKHFSQQDGLSSKEINGLALDHAGRLWASTDNGVDRLEDGRWRHYGAEDGLIWDDGDDRAMYVDAEDNVWIGTSGGLSRYSPPPFPIPDVRPMVVLTSIKGGSRQFQAGDRPVLSHAQNSILIRFSSLDYSSETRTRFRYRLQGYETSWSETREKDVQYAGHPAGQYVFEVMAAGPNGAWSVIPAQFAFSVQPPWWFTWWFLVSCLAAASLLGRAVWQFRVRALVMRQQLLELQIAERTAQLIESHRQLEEIAYHDMLTSLPNRRMFIDKFRSRLKQARDNSGTFALLLVDLDHFKQINDTFGHDAGDAVLIESAIRLREMIRECDCIARLGGDEFAILLTSVDDSAGIEAVCKRIIDAFVDEIPFQGATLEVRCSIGIARFPEDGDTQDGLFKSADIALYDAKQTGRNTFRWHRSTERVTA